MVRLYGTCPPSSALQGPDYLRHVVDLSKLCEAHEIEGMLIYTDNGLVDPWIVAQAMLECTERLRPLIAVQPIYMHPYTVAKKVATFAHLFRRRIALNLVAGGFVKDLATLGDNTPHDERYARLGEYVRIIISLLNDKVTTSNGPTYPMARVLLTPQMPTDLRPEIFMSGSSDAGTATALSVGATPVTYPPPPGELAKLAPGMARGLRIGVLARADADTAWTEATARFPCDRVGQELHKRAMNISDSVWHKQISAIAAQSADQAIGCYWLEPMRNYKTFCPYLVGSYDAVATELKKYIVLGADTFILDVLRDAADFAHVMEVFDRVGKAADGRARTR